MQHDRRNENRVGAGEPHTPEEEQARQAQMLKATEKLQSALLNSISHDLRTPLTVITGFASMLQRIPPDGHGQEQESSDQDVTATEGQHGFLLTGRRVGSFRGWWTPDVGKPPELFSRSDAEIGWKR